MKKIVGLSCGRKNGNSEILLKEAAKGAEEFGVETEIIRAATLNINPCTNCQYCARCFWQGKEVKCVIDDDVEWILEKTLLEDCALIISGPVYHLRANSTFMAINDRMLTLTMRHPEIQNKTRVGAIISVGGAGSDWTNLGLFTAQEYLQHTRVLVDQYQVNDAAEPGAVLFDYNCEQLKRVRQLGRNVAKAMSIPIEEVKYMGEDGDVSCPVCHCNVIQVPNALPEVVCPICWVHGLMVADGDKMKVVWNEEEAKKPRFSQHGINEHKKYIMNIVEKAKIAREKPELKEMIKQYKAYGNIIEPSSLNK